MKKTQSVLNASIAACFAACAPAAAASPIYGIARSMDGDSLHVGDAEVRLFGIDAPEWDQRCKRGGADWACGQEAAAQLSRLITGKEVRCAPVDIDKNGRTVARCTVGTLDVNRTMVALGYAVAFRQYSSEYASAEQTAKNNRRGIWAGTFTMPQAYRDEGDPLPVMRRSSPVRPSPSSSSRRAAVDAPPNSGCTIKGNQGSNGWIYHLPGMPYYNQTRAEQMFCSEAEARAAGYRRARVR